MPRHPPNALLTLDHSHCQCPSLFTWFGKPDPRRLRAWGAKLGPFPNHEVIGNTERPGSLQGSRPVKKPELPFTALARSDVINVFGPCLHDKRAGVHQAWVLKTSFSRFVR